MARFRFNFWLDCSKDEELLLAEQIDELKAKRSFSKTVRDGIRLICDLRAGRFDILFELFPELRKRFKEEGQADTGGEGSDELKAMSEQIGRLESLLIQQVPPSSGYTMSNRAPQLHTMSNRAPQLPTPEALPELPSIFADEEEAASPSEARQNFTSGLGNLFDEDEDLWEDEEEEALPIIPAQSILSTVNSAALPI